MDKYITLFFILIICSKEKFIKDELKKSNFKSTPYMIIYIRIMKKFLVK